MSCLTNYNSSCCQPNGYPPICCKLNCCKPSCCKPNCCQPNCCQPNCCKPKCCRSNCCKSKCCKPDRYPFQCQSNCWDYSSICVPCVPIPCYPVCPEPSASRVCPSSITTPCNSHYPLCF